MEHVITDISPMLNWLFYSESPSPVIFFSIFRVNAKLTILKNILLSRELQEMF